ncbi:MAG TPA: cytochrome c biogenesis protein CcdA [Salinivirgaceae bacterium]|nr:cytochrome c biogenesis protein CcdA [Salinivirgaceae bacterium]HQA75832.1 cytochrome c biogenesis protein CcdA [Salinivirgaceae bacterium]
MRKFILITFVGVLSALSMSVFSQVLEPVKWNFKVDKVEADIYEITGTASIDKGWHLYSQFLPEGNISIPTSFVFEPTEGVEFIGNVEELSKVIEQEDPMAGVPTRYYANEAIFVQKVKVSDENAVIKGYVEFMACDDENCIPPSEHEFELRVKDEPKTTITDDQQNRTRERSSIWGVIIEAILWGFAALLTPCVFPMVPMTVSFFIKSGEDKAKSKFLAGVFGSSIVILYTVPIAAIIFITYFFGGESVTADIFNWLSTHWIPNILFFVIFMFFAASFFGAFEIVLPSWMVSKADSKADKGGVIGTFFMALTLVLVSFSCTGPIVGTIIVKSTQGEIWEPVVTMLAFSIAFALPFTLFALFPSWLKNLPKSGGWLNSVKVVLGFIEVALGFKFLSVADQVYHWGLLDREVYLAIWIICFTLLGFYLLGKLKFKHDSDSGYISVTRLFLAMLSFTFVIYMLPGMWGAPLKALSGYLPPQQTLDFDLPRIINESTANISVYSSSETKTTVNKAECGSPKYGDFLQLPHGLRGYFDYEQGLKCAKELGKPVFIDFTGHGCVNCREMEANVWSDPRVLRLLRDEFVIVALYVDDKTPMPEEDWVVSERDGKVKKTIGKKYADFQISKYNVNAQPYYVLLDHEENILMPPRAYNLNADEFVRFLEQGIENFKEGVKNE